MMMCFILALVVCKNDCTTTPDQKNLTIIGKSEITQADTRTGIIHSLIEYVFIGEEIPKIGDYAFFEYTSLLEVHIPSSVVELGGYSFAHCTKLRNITFSEGLQTISSCALSYLNSLEELRLPASLKQIDFSIFTCSASKLHYYEIAKGNEVYSTDENHQFILSKDKKSALRSVSYPQTLTLPSYVETLNSHFASSKLVGLNFYSDSNLTTICSLSFRQCDIKSLRLPSKVKTIQDKTFWDSKLEEISLPASLTDLGVKAFDTLRYLKIIEIDSRNPSYKSEDGVIFDFNKTKLIFITPQKKTLNLPSTIVEISETAIQFSSLESAVINGSDVFSSYEGIIYKGMYEHVFACPGKLENAKIHKNCTKILDKAFIECSLKTIEFEGENLSSIGYMAFNNCPNLQSFPFDHHLELIDRYSFLSCTKLTGKIVFNKFLSTINVESFSYTSIIEADFSECGKLTKLSGSVFKKTKLIKITLPPNLAQIDAECFLGSSLQSLELGDKLEIIGDSAFEKCNSLTKITWGSGLKSIGENGFAETGLTGDIEPPSNLESLSTGVFSGCSGITSIRFRDDSKLLSVSTQAFSQCTNLRKIVFGESVSEIQVGAFIETNGLKEIIIADGNKNFKGVNGLVLSKNGRVLYGCAGGLEEIEVPKSVVEIREKSFYGCQLLANVTFEEERQLKSEINGIEEISESLFYGCISLERIKIPRSVRQISVSSFFGCVSLSSVRITSSSKLESIGEDSFHGCSSLSEVVFEGGCQLVDIGARGFAGCSQLESFEFPSEVKVIGAEAFDGCSSLRGVRIPHGVNTLSDFSFRGCDSIKWVTFCGTCEVGSENVFSEEVMRIRDGDKKK